MIKKMKRMIEMKNEDCKMIEREEAEEGCWKPGAFLFHFFIDLKQMIILLGLIKMFMVVIDSH